MLKSKEIVVTGATDGIGKVTARELARLGGSVTIVGRNERKCQDVVRDIRAMAGHDRVDYVVGDLSAQDGVRSVAQSLLSRLSKLDVLVNNAGGLFQSRELTRDGLERTFALNHLNYFTLSGLLLDRLRASGQARIVNVASEAHRPAKLDPGDWQCAKSYSGWTAYGRSKLANIYFTYALSKRLAGSRVSVNCLHPGFVATAFGDNNRGLLKFAIGAAKRFAALTEDDGAKTSIYLSSSPDVEGVHGKYFDKCKETKSSGASYDTAMGELLWAESERLTGLSFK